MNSEIEPLTQNPRSPKCPVQKQNKLDLGQDMRMKIKKLYNEFIKKG